MKKTQHLVQSHPQGVFALLTGSPVTFQPKVSRPRSQLEVATPVTTTNCWKLYDKCTTDVPQYKHRKTHVLWSTHPT